MCENDSVLSQNIIKFTIVLLVALIVALTIKELASHRKPTVIQILVPHAS